MYSSLFCIRAVTPSRDGSQDVEKKIQFYRINKFLGSKRVESSLNSGYETNTQN